MKEQKSFYPKKEDQKRSWRLVDADGKILGRLASEVATMVRGKDKATFTPSVDMGDFVVIINSNKIKLSGKKADQKMYYRHSGYPGGLKATSFKEQLSKDSTKIILRAVKGMLPGNRLGRQLLTKVRVYRTAEHPHTSQVGE